MTNTFKYLSGLLCGVAAAGMWSCSPDNPTMGDVPVSPEDLVQGIAYTVTTDAENHVYLKSELSGVIPCWETPSGRSQDSEVTLDLPFAGEYTVKYGVTTRAGVVWGEPYTFTLDQNNFEMLSDPIWTNLAGGVGENGESNPVTWVPMDRKYEPYQGSAPVGYMDPNNVKNNGDGTTEIYLDQWAMNWDPGFQSWLIASDDPYMNSEMTMYLDSKKGCVAEIKRFTADGEADYTTGFNLNVSNPKQPVITFTDGEMLHAAWGDGVCSNYSQEIKILTINPYVFQVATMRTNSEGPWWIVWNFVNKDVRDGKIQIPTDGPELINPKPVEEPKYTDLSTELFKISGDDATYVSSKTTYLLNEETPYDLMWWNGATGAWEWINGYGSSWAPAYTGIEDWALTLENNGKATLDSSAGSTSANFSVVGNKVVFDKEVTLLSTGNVSITGKEFTVMKCSADDNEVVFGIPVEYDSNGDANKYLCAKMTVKPISGGATGPLVLNVDNSKISPWVEADKYLRFQFYNPWAGMADGDFPVDPSKLKLKKGQKIVIKFTVSGVDWLTTPKCAACCNMEGFSWEPDCFSNFQAVQFNTNGENTLEIVNNTGSTYNFYGNGALAVSIDLINNADMSTFDISNVVVNVTSLTIE